MRTTVAVVVVAVVMVMVVAGAAVHHHQQHHNSSITTAATTHPPPHLDQMALDSYTKESVTVMSHQEITNHPRQPVAPRSNGETVLQGSEEPQKGTVPDYPQPLQRDILPSQHLSGQDFPPLQDSVAAKSLQASQSVSSFHQNVSALGSLAPQNNVLAQDIPAPQHNVPIQAIPVPMYASVQKSLTPHHNIPAQDFPVPQHNVSAPDFLAPISALQHNVTDNTHPPKLHVNHPKLEDEGPRSMDEWFSATENLTGQFPSLWDNHSMPHQQSPPTNRGLYQPRPLHSSVQEGHLENTKSRYLNPKVKSNLRQDTMNHTHVEPDLHKPSPGLPEPDTLPRYERTAVEYNTHLHYHHQAQPMAGSGTPFSTEEKDYQGLYHSPPLLLPETVYAPPIRPEPFLFRRLRTRASIVGEQKSDYYHRQYPITLPMLRIPSTEKLQPQGMDHKEWHPLRDAPNNPQDHEGQDSTYSFFQQQEHIQEDNPQNLSALEEQEPPDEYLDLHETIMPNYHAQNSTPEAHSELKDLALQPNQEKEPWYHYPKQGPSSVSSSPVFKHTQCLWPGHSVPGSSLWTHLHQKDFLSSAHVSPARSKEIKDPRSPVQIQSNEPNTVNSEVPGTDHLDLDSFPREHVDAEIYQFESSEKDVTPLHDSDFLQEQPMPKSLSNINTNLYHGLRLPYYSVVDGNTDEGFLKDTERNPNFTDAAVLSFESQKTYELPEEVTDGMPQNYENYSSVNERNNDPSSQTLPSFSSRPIGFSPVLSISRYPKVLEQYPINVDGLSNTDSVLPYYHDTLRAHDQGLLPENYDYDDYSYDYDYTLRQPSQLQPNDDLLPPHLLPEKTGVTLPGTPSLLPESGSSSISVPTSTSATIVTGPSINQQQIFPWVLTDGIRLTKGNQSRTDSSILQNKPGTTSIILPISHSPGSSIPPLVSFIQTTPRTNSISFPEELSLTIKPSPSPPSVKIPARPPLTLLSTTVTPPPLTPKQELHQPVGNVANNIEQVITVTIQQPATLFESDELYYNTEAMQDFKQPQNRVSLDSKIVKDLQLESEHDGSRVPRTQEMLNISRIQAITQGPRMQHFPQVAGAQEKHVPSTQYTPIINERQPERKDTIHLPKLHQIPQVLVTGDTMQVSKTSAAKDHKAHAGQKHGTKTPETPGIKPLKVLETQDSLFFSIEPPQVPKTQTSPHVLITEISKAPETGTLQVSKTHTTQTPGMLTSQVHKTQTSQEPLTKLSQVPKSYSLESSATQTPQNQGIQNSQVPGIQISHVLRTQNPLIQETKKSQVLATQRTQVQEKALQVHETQILPSLLDETHDNSKSTMGNTQAPVIQHQSIPLMLDETASSTLTATVGLQSLLVPQSVPQDHTQHLDDGERGNLEVFTTPSVLSLQEADQEHLTESLHPVTSRTETPNAEQKTAQSINKPRENDNVLVVQQVIPSDEDINSKYTSFTPIPSSSHFTSHMPQAFTQTTLRDITIHTPKISMDSQKSEDAPKHVMDSLSFPNHLSKGSELVTEAFPITNKNFKKPSSSSALAADKANNLQILRSTEVLWVNFTKTYAVDSTVLNSTNVVKSLAETIKDTIDPTYIILPMKAMGNYLLDPNIQEQYNQMPRNKSLQKAASALKSNKTYVPNIAGIFNSEQIFANVNNNTHLPDPVINSTKVKVPTLITSPEAMNDTLKHLSNIPADDSTQNEPFSESHAAMMPGYEETSSRKELNIEENIPISEDDDGDFLLLPNIPPSPFSDDDEYIIIIPHKNDSKFSNDIPLSFQPLSRFVRQEDLGNFTVDLLSGNQGTIKDESLVSRGDSSIHQRVSQTDPIQSQNFQQEERPDMFFPSIRSTQIVSDSKEQNLFSVSPNTSQKWLTPFSRNSGLPKQNEEDIDSDKKQEEDTTQNHEELEFHTGHWNSSILIEKMFNTAESRQQVNLTLPSTVAVSDNKPASPPLLPKDIYSVTKDEYYPKHDPITQVVVNISNTYMEPHISDIQQIPQFSKSEVVSQIFDGNSGSQDIIHNHSNRSLQPAVPGFKSPEQYGFFNQGQYPQYEYQYNQYTDFRPSGPDSTEILTNDENVEYLVNPIHVPATDILPHNKKSKTHPLPNSTEGMQQHLLDPLNNSDGKQMVITNITTGINEQPHYDRELRHHNNIHENMELESNEDNNNTVSMFRVQPSRNTDFELMVGPKKDIDKEMELDSGVDIIMKAELQNSADNVHKTKQYTYIDTVQEVKIDTGANVQKFQPHTNIDVQRVQTDTNIDVEQRLQPNTFADVVLGVQPATDADVVQRVESDLHGDEHRKESDLYDDVHKEEPYPNNEVIQGLEADTAVDVFKREEPIMGAEPQHKKQEDVLKQETEYNFGNKNIHREALGHTTRVDVALQSDQLLYIKDIDNSEYKGRLEHNKGVSNNTNRRESKHNLVSDSIVQKIEPEFEHDTIFDIHDKSESNTADGIHSIVNGRSKYHKGVLVNHDDTAETSKLDYNTDNGNIDTSNTNFVTSMLEYDTKNNGDFSTETFTVSDGLITTVSSTSGTVVVTSEGLGDNIFGDLRIFNWETDANIANKTSESKAVQADLEVNSSSTVVPSADIGTVTSGDDNGMYDPRVQTHQGLFISGEINASESGMSLEETSGEYFDAEVTASPDQDTWSNTDESLGEEEYLESSSIVHPSTQVPLSQDAELLLLIPNTANKDYDDLYLTTNISTPHAIDEGVAANEEHFLVDQVDTSAGRVVYVDIGAVPANKVAVLPDSIIIQQTNENKSLPNTGFSIKDEEQTLNVAALLSNVGVPQLTLEGKTLTDESIQSVFQMFNPDENIEISRESLPVNGDNNGAKAEKQKPSQMINNLKRNNMTHNKDLSSDFKPNVFEPKHPDMKLQITMTEATVSIPLDLRKHNTPGDDEEETSSTFGVSVNIAHDQLPQEQWNSNGNMQQPSIISKLPCSELPARIFSDTVLLDEEHNIHDSNAQHSVTLKSEWSDILPKRQEQAPSQMNAKETMLNQKETQPKLMLQDTEPNDDIYSDTGSNKNSLMQDILPSNEKQTKNDTTQFVPDTQILQLLSQLFLCQNDKITAICETLPVGLHTTSALMDTNSSGEKKALKLPSILNTDNGEGDFKLKAIPGKVEPDKDVQVHEVETKQFLISEKLLDNFKIVNSDINDTNVMSKGSSHPDELDILSNLQKPQEPFISLNSSIKIESTEATDSREHLKLNGDTFLHLPRESTSNIFLQNSRYLKSWVKNDPNTENTPTMPELPHILEMFLEQNATKPGLPGLFSPMPITAKVTETATPTVLLPIIKHASESSMIISKSVPGITASSQPTHIPSPTTNPVLFLNRVKNSEPLSSGNTSSQEQELKWIWSDTNNQAAAPTITNSSGTRGSKNIVVQNETLSRHNVGNIRDSAMERWVWATGTKEALSYHTHKQPRRSNKQIPNNFLPSPSMVSYVYNTAVTSSINPLINKAKNSRTLIPAIPTTKPYYWYGVQQRLKSQYVVSPTRRGSNNFFRISKIYSGSRNI